MQPGLEPYVGGLDLSLTSSGTTRLGRLTDSTVIGRKGITTLKLDERINEIEALADDVVCALCDTNTRSYGPVGLPALVLIEAPDTSHSYGGLVERVSLTHAVTSRLLGNGVPVGWVPSAVLKGYATGKGGGPAATKTAIRDVAAELWPELGIERTKPKSAQYDQADSAILAAMALDVLGLGRRVPDTHADEWLRRDSIKYPASLTAGA